MTHAIPIALSLSALVALSACRDTMPPPIDPVPKKPIELPAALRDSYNAQARDHKAQTWTRTPDSPLGPLEAGAAAPLYQKAHTLQRAPLPENLPRLGQLLRAGSTPKLSTSPAACQDIKVPAQTGDVVLQLLTEPVCAAIRDNAASLSLVAQASRRADNTSPFSIWDPWVVDDEGQLRGPTRLRDHADLNTILGYINAQSAKRPEPLLDALAVQMAMGVDLPRSGDMISAMFSTVVVNEAVDTLTALLASPGTVPMGPAQHAFVLETLLHTHANLQDEVWMRVVQSDYLMFIHTIAPTHEGLLTAPAAAAQPPQPAFGSPYLTLALSEAMDKAYEPLWSQGFSPSSEQRSDNYKAYQAVALPFGIKDRVPYQRFDLIWVYTRSRLCRAALGYADLIHQHQHKAVPKTLDSLDPRVLKACKVEELSGVPFEYRDASGKRWIHGLVVDHEALKKLPASLDNEVRATPLALPTLRGEMF